MQRPPRVLADYYVNSWKFKEADILLLYPEMTLKLTK